MPKEVFKLNPGLIAQWKSGVAELASITNAKDPQSVQKLVMQSGRRFVKNVAAITAPATGTLDSSAKKRGEQAILGDILKIAMPATVVGSSRQAREALADASELLAVYERARVGAEGRVNPRGRREKLLTSPAVFNALVTKLQKRVGWLAAGLNAAAERLGFSLPSWIKRHGSKFGKIEVKASRHGMRIRIIQNVPYADDVDGYSKKWDWALRKEVQALVAMVKAIVARKAGRARAKLMGKR